MAWPEFTMYSQEPAPLSYKVTRTKSVKSNLTPRATRSLLPQATRPVDYGALRQVMRFNASELIQERVTKMKFSLVLSTTRAIRSSRDQKIILAAFGRIKDL